MCSKELPDGGVCFDWFDLSVTEEGSNEIDDDILGGVDSDNDTTKDDNDILSRQELIHKVEVASNKKITLTSFRYKKIEFF